MAIIKLVEDYSVIQLRKDVRDSLMMAGEQAILLQTYHSGEHDAEPCPECGDDIYNSAEKACTSCYGTMFDKGVRHGMKIWALFTDHQVNEQLGKQGTYEPDHRHVQLEAFPLVTEHDIVVRIANWDSDGKPIKVDGYWLFQAVDRRSLRTGNQRGQWNRDIVGQKGDISELPLNHGISKYPVLGQLFEEAMGGSVSITSPASVSIQPDHGTIYFPFGSRANPTVT